ncbi:MAG: ABC transporter ATP-binding protein [Eubacteriales bacterium]|jgi:ATP-binding cassette subfamily B protein|nr:ABC transporter ATP-binding protein [Eubacteriales bacterium]MDD3572841.1 ABC transporter ATP-binding protein [Eubacteriales bacterium]MDD4134898.1 ABC transporter ATP-binding protein [Eubacteriales bacterium]NLO12511.1 ABC transporter ATP-binding protein [Clostridiales bacterium]
MSKTSRSAGLIRRFIPYYRPYRRILVTSLVCAALTTASGLIFPLIVQQVTDRAISDITSLTLGFILRMGGFFLALQLMDAGCRYYMQSRGHIMGAMMEKDMRSDLFGHLSQLSFSYYSNTKVGQIMARITHDLFEVTEFAHHCPEEFLIGGVNLVASFVLLSAMNLELTLIIFLMLPVMFVSIFLFNRKMRATFRAARHQVGEINARMEDSLLGMRVVQSFANEELEGEKFEQGNRTFLNLKKRQYHVMAGFHSTTRLLSGLMNLLVVVLGAFYLSRGRLTAGQFASYLLYINMLLATVSRLVDFMEQFQRGVTGIERFAEIMDAPMEIRDLPGAVPLKDVKGEITLDNISFQYEEGGAFVLNEVNLKVPAGQNVALVGPSGSGKTTLCNLIPRFYDVAEGRILVDGQDVRSLTLRSLRGAIGTVQQEVYLFSGTIYDNIVYGKPQALREEVIAAAKKAGAHGFIEALPHGYDTHVGERGVKLSGGQKQRISIARVFLKDPPILLLDEATSALDNESELLVQRSLEELARGRTTLTIAHRLTTIRNADVIWVLTDQGLEEHGSHEELMDRGGLYYRLYHLYANHDIKARKREEALL